MTRLGRDMLIVTNEYSLLFAISSSCLCVTSACRHGFDKVRCGSGSIAAHANQSQLLAFLARLNKNLNYTFILISCNRYVQN